VTGRLIVALRPRVICGFISKGHSPGPCHSRRSAGPGDFKIGVYFGWFCVSFRNKCDWSGLVSCSHHAASAGVSTVVYEVTESSTNKQHTLSLTPGPGERLSQASQSLVQDHYMGEHAFLQGYYNIGPTVRLLAHTEVECLLVSNNVLELLSLQRALGWSPLLPQPRRLSPSEGG
jgi:hypothetical protein